MKDDILGMFIDEMLSKEIDEVEFKQNIDLFSRFLSYCNSDYRYNGTYLCQYTDDFIKISEMLKRKHKKYKQIFSMINRLGYNYELLIDQMFWAGITSDSTYGNMYVGINKDKLANRQIELKITLMMDNMEYIFCKKYNDFEEKKLIQTIKKDVKSYITNKDIRRTKNGIA